MEGLCTTCNVGDTSNLNKTLWRSTRKGCVDCLRLLIQAGADANILHDLYPDYTPLMCAAENGRVECVKSLIEAGADVNYVTENYSNDTPLMYALQGGHALVKAMAEVNSEDLEFSPFTRAIKTNHIDCMKVLIEAGADVNIMNEEGNTALMIAALHNKRNHSKLSVKCAKLLLQAGAKVNMVNSTSHNALQCHIVHQTWKPSVHLVHKTMVMLLFAAGETIEGNTVVKVGTSGRVIQVPDYLLHKDLKLNLKHLSRETIRKHLINIDSHKHLFGRIPQLKLPSLLEEYLLFDVSLDDDQYHSDVIWR